MAEEQTKEVEASLETIMGLIVNGGNAKSSAFEAIKAAKEGDFETADAKLKEADNFITEAHNSCFFIHAVVAYNGRQLNNGDVAVTRFSLVKVTKTVTQGQPEQH